MRFARGRTTPGLVLAACVVLLASGCGYEAVRYSETFGEQNRVALRGFRNDTMEVGIDALVSDAMAREISHRGALRLVDDPAAADWIITGVVRDVQTRNRSFSSISFSLEYEVRLRLRVTVQRRDGSTLALDAASLSETERYLASADVEVARTNREQALRRLSGILAARVHDAFYERASIQASTPLP